MTIVVATVVLRNPQRAAANDGPVDAIRASDGRSWSAEFMVGAVAVMALGSGGGEAFA